MKSILLSFVAIFAIILMSFNKEKTDKYEGFYWKDIENSVVKIKDNLYASKFEVTNVQFRAFRHILITNNRLDLLEVTKIDSSNWLDKLMYNEPYANMYFRHPAYSNYPVVNVSFDGAKLFCEWLTSEYNANPKRKYKKVLFRLPTEGEWEYAASNGKEQVVYPWGNKLFMNGHFMCNFTGVGEENIKMDTLTKKIYIERDNSLGIAGSLSDNADITAPVNSYYPNEFGLYNVCGNVAEMTSEKGISKGGSWKCMGGDVKIKSTAHYRKSQADLGFRYFMEVVEQ